MSVVQEKTEQFQIVRIQYSTPKGIRNWMAIAKIAPRKQEREGGGKE